MEIQVEQAGATVSVLQCCGSLDAATVHQFRQVAQRLLGESAVCLVLDGSRLDFVDSTGLGAMVALQRKLKVAGGDLKVAALGADVRSIFAVTRLDRVFDVCQSVRDACQRFAPNTHGH